jgi:hypothetical protein
MASVSRAPRVILSLDACTTNTLGLSILPVAQKGEDEGRQPEDALLEYACWPA